MKNKKYKNKAKTARVQRLENDTTAASSKPPGRVLIRACSGLPGLGGNVDVDIANSADGNKLMVSTHVTRRINGISKAEVETDNHRGTVEVTAIASAPLGGEARKKEMEAAALDLLAKAQPGEGWESRLTPEEDARGVDGVISQSTNQKTVQVRLLAQLIKQLTPEGDGFSKGPH